MRHEERANDKLFGIARPVMDFTSLRSIF